MMLMRAACAYAEEVRERDSVMNHVRDQIEREERREGEEGREGAGWTASAPYDRELVLPLQNDSIILLLVVVKNFAPRCTILKRLLLLPLLLLARAWQAGTGRPGCGSPQPTGLRLALRDSVLVL